MGVPVRSTQVRADVLARLFLPVGGTVPNERLAQGRAHSKTRVGLAAGAAWRLPFVETMWWPL